MLSDIIFWLPPSSFLEVIPTYIVLLGILISRLTVEEIQVGVRGGADNLC
jgi:hypothetical protein